jgi:hypothetical protein
VATVTGRTVSSPLPPCDTPPAVGPVPARPDGLSRAEIRRAVPASSRRVRSWREARDAGPACPDLAGVRRDFRDSLEAWWRLHVTYMTWEGPAAGTSQPTRELVCDKCRTGRRDPVTGERGRMSITVYKRCRRWWAERGYVAIVRPGSTPALRPAALTSPDDYNERQVYVLCVPRKTRCQPDRESDHDSNGPLSCFRRKLELPARETSGHGPAKPGKPAMPRPPLLRRGPLRRLTDGWWAHLTRPFAASGWTLADLTWAIDYAPDSGQHRMNPGSVRHPAGWLRWRLSRWLGPDGVPVPSPSQVRKANRERVLAEQAARRQAREAAAREAAKVDVPARAAELRAILAAVRQRQTSAANRAGRRPLESA